KRVAKVAPAVSVACIVADVLPQLGDGFVVAVERHQLDAEHVTHFGNALRRFAQLRDFLVAPSGELEFRGEVLMRARIAGPAIDDALPESERGEVLVVALNSCESED